jgi:hypothetical protein
VGRIPLKTRGLDAETTDSDMMASIPILIFVDARKMSLPAGNPEKRLFPL